MMKRAVNLAGMIQKNTRLFSITFRIKTEIPVKSSFTGITKRIKKENRIYSLNPIEATMLPALFFKYAGAFGLSCSRYG
jgi:hypothetical protein